MNKLKSAIWATATTVGIIWAIYIAYRIVRYLLTINVTAEMIGYIILIVFVATVVIRFWLWIYRQARGGWPL